MLFERNEKTKLLTFEIKELCFLPLDYIVGVFDNLKNEIFDKNLKKLAYFINYFEENWINLEHLKIGIIMTLLYLLQTILVNPIITI